MRYFSTRGGDDTLSFEQAVLTGLAPNGGLYIPQSIPSLPTNWESEWSSYSFQELSHAILSLYIPSSEIPSADLRQLIDTSYASFRHPRVTPLKKLRDGEYVLELWHGPTFAFKDVALQFLGNLFEYFLKRRNEGKKEGEERETLTVVGATSGDTGSAAIYGLRGKSDIDIFILHPKNRVSPIQEAQMTTVTDSNVHNVAVAGTFDDCQDIVKALFADTTFNERYHLGAVNSINWARILAQIVYYFAAYFDAKELLEEGAKLQFVVPTGNFGDILAGWYAKQMGLPMDKLVVATNANDILARFWASGRYEKHSSSSSSTSSTAQEPAIATDPAAGASDGAQSQGGVRETLSPAMDILISSNFERLLWYLARDSLPSTAACAPLERERQASAVLKKWMDSLKSDGKAEVPSSALELARKDFEAERVDDKQTMETIRAYFEAKDGFIDASYVVDPHTAVGLTVGRRVSGQNASNVHQIILSTAHPAKFSEAVTSSLSTSSSSSSFNFERDVLPEEFKGLLEKPRRVIDVPRAEVGLIKEVIVQVLGRGKIGTEGEGNASV